MASDRDGGLLEPGERGIFWFTVTNRAARAAVAGTQITLACDDPHVQLLAASRKLGRLAPMAAVDLQADPFPIAVDAACPDGHVAQVSVSIDWGEGPLSGSLQFMVGRRDTILVDDLTSTTNWLLEGAWGPSPVAHSAPTALTDSPAGDHAIDSATSATLAGNRPAGLLTFWHRHQLERGYDFGRVQVAPDGGAWTTVASFTGEQSAWEQAAVDLGAYAGQSLRLRFQLTSDFSVTADGWDIDDVVLLGGHDGNVTPPPPQAVAPLAGVEVSARPTLEVASSTDPDGEDPLTYGFRVYADALLTRMVARVDDLPAGADGPDWTVPAPLPPGTYWWRAYAADGSERGRLAPARCFTVRAAASEDPPVIDGPRLAVLGAVGGEARLRLDLPRPARVRAAVHDARGARVCDLHDGSAPRGRRILVWDGRDDAGRSAASGVYLVRVTVDGRALTGRVVLLR